MTPRQHLSDTTYKLTETVTAYTRPAQAQIRKKLKSSPEKEMQYRDIIKIYSRKIIDKKKKHWSALLFAVHTRFVNIPMLTCAQVLMASFNC